MPRGTRRLETEKKKERKKRHTCISWLAESPSTPKHAWIVAGLIIVVVRAESPKATPSAATGTSAKQTH